MLDLIFNGVAVGDLRYDMTARQGDFANKDKKSPPTIYTHPSTGMTWSAGRLNFLMAYGHL
jgi:hypothetical protein